MPDTKISIEIKDKIAAGIAPKLDAIGKAAAGAAPGLQAFKTVWKGFDFSGMAGLGLGRVNNQLKAVKKSTYDLRRSSEQLLTSQLRTKNTSAQYEKTLNSFNRIRWQMNTYYITDGLIKYYKTIKLTITGL